MKRTISLILSALLIATIATHTAHVFGDSASAGKLILEDDFNREEVDPTKEQIGNEWGTNSQSRAQGNKQVDLADGAMHITMHPVADHGVSVYHDIDFRDATIEMSFKLGIGDDLGINIADMKEKSVHAGHLCVARIKLNQLEISDLKTGRMNLEMRDARKSNKLTPKMNKLIASKSKKFDLDLTADQWHKLSVQIAGDVMRVSIDGHVVGEFQSPGIAHPTKRRLRLSVNKSAWVDDVKIWEQSGI